MNASQRKQLLKSQQGELDAVVLYQRLSQLVKEPKAKEVLLSIAKDEGRHAAIIKKYTNETLYPKNAKANLITILYKILGKNFIAGLLEKGELASLKPYGILAKDFPEIKKIMEDEKRHASLSRQYLKTK